LGDVYNIGTWINTKDFESSPSISSDNLPGQIITYFSGIGIYFSNGKPAQKVGILPDIEVHPTIKGIREGRDEVLEKAIEIINKK
jgi:C-terminal processing protease CtpA/Prc